jgi:hypothetical protein
VKRTFPALDRIFNINKTSETFATTDARTVYLKYILQRYMYLDFEVQIVQILLTHKQTTTFTDVDNINNDNCNLQLETISNI